MTNCARRILLIGNRKRTNPSRYSPVFTSCNTTTYYAAVAAACRLSSSSPSSSSSPPSCLITFQQTNLSYPSQLTKSEDRNQDDGATSRSVKRIKKVPSSSHHFNIEPFDWKIMRPASSQQRSTPKRTTNNISVTTWDDQDQKEHPEQETQGYLVLGRNGSGKSLIGQALLETNEYRGRHYKQMERQQQHDSSVSSSSPHNPYVSNGILDVHDIDRWHSQSVAYVSFDSHEELLQQQQPRQQRLDGDDTTAGSITAFRAIAGDGVSKLNKAAQFLVVRFGLFSLLHRPVTTLSTGEIRKVLLIRALSKRPHCLILDNAFDGLDVPSREILKDIVRRTLRGFTQDILVHDVSAKATATTQVILMTHRIEEMMVGNDGIQNVAALVPVVNGNHCDSVPDYGYENDTNNEAHCTSMSSTFRVLDTVDAINDNIRQQDETKDADIDGNKHAKTNGYINRNNNMNKERNESINDSNDGDDGWVEHRTDETYIRSLRKSHSIMMDALGIYTDNSRHLNNSGGGHSNQQENSGYETPLATIKGDYGLGSFDWDDPSLPSTDSVRRWWKLGRSTNYCESNDLRDDGIVLDQPVLVEAHDLSIRRGKHGKTSFRNDAGDLDDSEDVVTLLHNLNWTIRESERWIVGGGNGAGKSTLSRLLAHPDKEHGSLNTGRLDIQNSIITSWVSTESHLNIIHRLKTNACPSNTSPTVKEFLLQESKVCPSKWDDVVLPLLRWVGMIMGSGTDSKTLSKDCGNRNFESRLFLHLSQGEQKMVLIVAALAAWPSLLVLDEPCQGLDVVNRSKVLTLVNRICQATNMSLVYITHHYEEILPTVEHALHLKDRYAVYNGSIDGYEPTNYQEKSK